MTKLKNLILFLLLILAMSMMVVPASFVFAGQEVLFKTEVDAGYWDIWQHSDGRWQYTGQPGEQKAYDFEITEPAEAKNFENVRYEMVVGITEEQYFEAGGRTGYTGDDDGWRKFDEDVLRYGPDNYRKIGQNKVFLALAPTDGAKRIKKDWQGEKVNGWRWYLPITIKWYGVGGEKPDFGVTTLSAGTDKTEPGEPYTGTVTYKLKDTAKESVEAILHMTHNGFGLKTPDGGSIHNKILTFQPGEEKTFQFSWSGQNTDSILRAEIWPTEPANLEKEQRDADPEDNVMEMRIPRAGYKLTVRKTGQGTTVPAVGVHYYPANERVDLSAKPETGWKFVRWEGDISSGNPNALIIMDSDKEVTAVFERATHTLKIIVNIAPGGTTTPKPGTHTFGHGETVNIKAIPSAGWKFNGWKIDASGTNPSVNVLMDKDKTVIAEFEQNIPQPMDPGKPGGVGPPRLLPK